MYAKCGVYDRRKLWVEGLNVEASPWLVMGDFNYIRHDEERMGGQPRSRMTMEEFNTCINNCRLVDLKSFGGT